MIFNMLPPRLWRQITPELCEMMAYNLSACFLVRQLEVEAHDGTPCLYEGALP